MIDDARGGGADDPVGGSSPAVSSAAASPPPPPVSDVGVAGGAGATPAAAQPAAAAGGDSGAAAGVLGVAGERVVCPVPGCGEVCAGGVECTGGFTHLHRHHLLREIPAAVMAALHVEGCRWCSRPFCAAAGRRGRSALSYHEPQCPLNPRRRGGRATAEAAPRGEAGGGAPFAGGASAPCAAGGRRLFDADPPAWEAARAEFLLRVAPPDADWAPLVASGARTAAHVPAALEGAWRALCGDALDWARRVPEQRLAWLWLLLLPTLALHVPGRLAADGAPPPLSHAARAAALLDGDFVAVLADRNAGVWRPPRGGAAVRRGGGGSAAAGGAAGCPASPGRPSAAQRRALRQAAVGRLGAAARSLVADAPAPQTGEVW